MKFENIATGPTASQVSKPTDLASRVFEHRAFELGWVIFLLLVLTFVSFPIQRVLLVFWVYGRDAYFHHGMRVMPQKPLRFSDGVRVPQELDILTGVGMFLATTFGLSAALFFGLRLYERKFLRPQSSRQR